MALGALRGAGAEVLPFPNAAQLQTSIPNTAFAAYVPDSAGAIAHFVQQSGRSEGFQLFVHAVAREAQLIAELDSR